MKLLKYKNYIGSVNIDTEKNILFGRVEFIKALITYEAKHPAELKQNFEAAINDYLAFCEHKKIKPEHPFKGSLNIRIGEDRHRHIWMIAEKLNKSLNDVICLSLDQTIQNKRVPSIKALSKDFKKSKISRDKPYI